MGEIFIVGDYAHYPTTSDVLERIKNLDGVTFWAGYFDPTGWYDGSYDYEAHYLKTVKKWYDWLKENKEKGELPHYFAFICSIIPEFDSRYVYWGDPHQKPVERDLERFYKHLELPYCFPKVNIRIDTWNDWYESTAIEPSVDWKYEFLDAVKKALYKHLERKT